MKQLKAVLSTLLALYLLLSACAVAYAHEVPDPDRAGTITVEMTYKGKSVKGGTLTIYRVGQIANDDENYSFTKTARMAGFSGSYADIGSADLAQSVADYVSKQKLPAYATARNRNGKAVFSGLELGLYLVVQTQASSGFEPLNPFLISVPMNEDGHYVYSVTAEGKFALTREPDEPENPRDPRLPQTGQVNWPVPLMAALGVVLFAAGWVLRAGGRKERYED